MSVPKRLRRSRRRLTVLPVATMWCAVIVTEARTSWAIEQLSAFIEHAKTTNPRAKGLAEERYASGAATQLDVLQAQRDKFRTDVSRTHADTDLICAHAALRLSARLATTDKENR